MYVVHPPQGSDPGARSSDGSGDLQVYQAWKGSNIFLLRGRFVFGPDVRSLGLTIFLIVAPVTIFCIFVARELMDAYSNHWGVSIMVVAVIFTIYVLVLLVLTSGRDPGIIPRNAHPPEPEGYDGNTEAGTAQTPQLRLPRTKDIELPNKMTVRIKYCDTCMLYRPPRCSHCSICNNCVERFDHHCPWVGQCIGLRNYRLFFMFVFSTTLLCIYVFAFCWVYIRRIMSTEEITVWKAMIKTPASIVLIVYTFIAMWFAGGLSAFHLYLISRNQTTYENFRYRYDQSCNPYNRGFVGNFGEIFFTSIPPSKNNFRAKVPREPVLPTRSVGGGGFMSPNMGKAGDDIEMHRKAVWGNLSPRAEYVEEHLNNGSRENIKDGELGEISAGIRTDEEDTGERAGVHPRRSSWGRKSGSWNMSPEVLALASRVGAENNIVGSSSSNRLTTDNTHK